MISIKGFYSVPRYSNNQDNSTAIFGELTPQSASYTRDPKTYSRGASWVNFSLFFCKEASARVELTQVYSDLACEVGEWAYEVGPTISSVNTKQDFIQMMQVKFGSRISNVNAGPLVTDTSRRMPTWLSWDVVANNKTYRYKVWLASLDFESSYDEFEILVVPPVDRIDKLFMPYADLVSELEQNTLAVIHERMLTVRNKVPESVVRTEMVELIDRTNTTNRRQIGWTVLIYGIAGDTTDLIKDAIKAYVSSNSTSTEADWRLLMPDLFNTTCFYVVPRWDKFAIQPRLGMPGVHSPIMGATEHLTYMKTATAAYISTAHLEANLQSTTHRYKSISLGIVGGQQNRLNLFKFTDYFPDYVAEESGNEDFNRQTQATKDITTILTTILLKIDNYETDPRLPTNVRLIEKNNQRYLVGKLNNIEYYVLMKPTQQP